jgi:electron transport complex protein RnfB
MRIARIIEADCIGCTKCLKACPVDAILGAAGQLHAVLIEHCTGCEACLPPCPVDCIELVESSFAWDEDRDRAALARENAHAARLTRRKAADSLSPQSGREPGPPPFDPSAAQAQIRAAVARSEARRRGRSDAP